MSKMETVQEQTFQTQKELDDLNIDILKELDIADKEINTVEKIYGDVKKLLSQYKQINDTLNNKYIKEMEPIRGRVLQLTANNKEQSKQYEQLHKSYLNNRKDYDNMQKYIDKLWVPLSKWKTELIQLRNNGELNKEKVKSIIGKSVSNKKKVDEYWAILSKIDIELNKLSTITDDVSSYIDKDSYATKNATEEIKNFKKRLEKVALQTGGKYIHNIAKKNNLHNNVFIKKLTTPFSKKHMNIIGGNKPTKLGIYLKDTPQYIFKNLNRKDLNKLSKSWGITNTRKYKNRDNLSNALKVLLVYKGGKIHKNKNLYTICKNLDINYKLHNRKNIKKMITNKIKNIHL